MNPNSPQPRSKPRWLDNLIPLKARLSEPQLAGWTPGAPVHAGLGCQILADQWVAMGDGTRLAADVYLPKASGPCPAIVSFGGYTKELHSTGLPLGSNEVGCPPVFTNRGYAHVIASCRGMGKSEGEHQPFFSDEEVDDLDQVIAWAAQQPWCNGEVVLYGTSYYAMLQAHVAIRRPPALKAFFANEMCTDYYRHIAMYGGAPNSIFLGLWLGANFNPAMVRLSVKPIVRAAISQLVNSPAKRLWWPLLQRKLSRVLLSFQRKTPTQSARRWYANLLFDAKTRAQSVMPSGPSGRLGEIVVPFVVVQNEGNWNLHQFGTYDLWDNAATPNGRKWMIIARPHFVLPSYSWQLEALAFFDHIVGGAQNGYAGQAPVRYWLHGPDRFKSAEDFPPPGCPKRLYPSGPDCGTSVHALVSSAPSTGQACWAAVPFGARTVGGLEEMVEQTLTFDWTAEAPCEFSGAVTLNLSFSCNEMDSHVVARLSKIAPDGSSVLLSMGMLRPARRSIDLSRSTRCEVAIDTDVTEPLTPGVPVTLRFSLTPSPFAMAAGERLRLDIGSRTDLLRGDPGEGHIHFDCQVPPYFSRNTLHFGQDTYLELHGVHAGCGLQARP